jgi:hypothetical protein
VLVMLLAVLAVASHPAGAAAQPGGPAVPATVYGVPGNGGLPLETDLGVGPASVAVANTSGVFVVTAHDGAYHRLRLPGYDARLYDAGVPGMALSPDGTRLAYAWHAQARPTGEGVIPSGLRVLDLVTGVVRTGPVLDPVDSGPTRLGVLAWNLSWAPGSRFVAYEEMRVARFPRSWLPDPDARRTAGLLDSTTGEQVVDAVGYRGSMPPKASPAGLLVLVERNGRDSSRLVTWGGDGLAARGPTVDWPLGRVSPDGAWLAHGPGTDLSMALQKMPGRTVTTELLSAGKFPQDWELDLLGWSSADRLLAVVRRADRPGRYGGQVSARAGKPVSRPPEGDLVTLTLGRHYRTGRIWRAPNRRVRVEQVGRITGGDVGTAFSFATDLARQDPPTRWFEPPSFVDGRPGSSISHSATMADAADDQQPPGDDPMERLIWVLVAFAAVGAAAAGVLVLSSRWRPDVARSGT